jgi:hypothetical protein
MTWSLSRNKTSIYTSFPSFFPFSVEHCFHVCFFPEKSSYDNNSRIGHVKKFRQETCEAPVAVLYCYYSGNERRSRL